MNHLEYDWQSPIWGHVFRRLSREHTLIRYDARGNGMSDWDVDRLSLDAWVTDLETVVDAVGVEHFPILGISQGGPVAIAYAVRRPERVSHLILYGTFALGGKKRSPAEREMRDAMTTLMRIGWGADNPSFRQMFTARFIPGGTHEQADYFNELQLKTTSPECAARYFDVVGDFDVTDLLPEVKAPTLVMHVRGDAICPFEAGCQLAAGIPGAHFIALPGRNHLFLEHEPACDRFFEEISLFLSAPAVAQTRPPGPAAARSTSAERWPHPTSISSAERRQLTAEASAPMGKADSHQPPAPTVREAKAALSTRPPQRADPAPATEQRRSFADEASPPLLPLPNKPSIAVLPFQNMSGDPAQDYFADGMVEDIVTGLSRIRWLFVIARHSSFVYRGKSVSVEQIGRELGVRYLLEGSVRKSETRVRVTAQLVEAETGAHLWADRFDGDLKDVFDLQDRITERVVGIVEPSVQKFEIERSRRKRPESLDAYDFYLRALPFVRSLDPESAPIAAGLLNDALKAYPNFALAHAYLAWSHQIRFTRADFDEAEKAVAIRHARAAIADEVDDATALAIGAYVIGLLGNHKPSALEAIERALSFNPSSAAAHFFGGFLYAWSGDPVRGTDLAERALRLSPFDPLTYQAHLAFAVASLHQGRYEEFGGMVGEMFARQSEVRRFRRRSISRARIGRTHERGEGNLCEGARTRTGPLQPRTSLTRIRPRDRGSMASRSRPARRSGVTPCLERMKMPASSDIFLSGALPSRFKRRRLP